MGRKFLDRRFPKVRRRFHRAFLNWYGEKQSGLTLICKKRRDRYIEFSIQGIQSAISVVVTTYDVIISISWQGECWDLLAAFEAAPKTGKNGFYCDLCLGETIEWYSSPEQLWQQHVFEPFWLWLNQELSSANWLGIYQHGGATWAKLIDAPDTEAEANLSLQGSDIV